MANATAFHVSAHMQTVDTLQTDVYRAGTPLINPRSLLFDMQAVGRRHLCDRREGCGRRRFAWLRFNQQLHSLEPAQQVARLLPRYIAAGLLQPQQARQARQEPQLPASRLLRT